MQCLQKVCLRICPTIENRPTNSPKLQEKSEVVSAHNLEGWLSLLLREYTPNSSSSNRALPICSLCDRVSGICEYPTCHKKPGPKIGRFKPLALISRYMFLSFFKNKTPQKTDLMF